MDQNWNLKRNFVSKTKVDQKVFEDFPNSIFRTRAIAFLSNKYFQSSLTCLTDQENSAQFSSLRIFRNKSNQERFPFMEHSKLLPTTFIPLFMLRIQNLTSTHKKFHPWNISKYLSLRILWRQKYSRLDLKWFPKTFLLVFQKYELLFICLRLTNTRLESNSFRRQSVQFIFPF